MFFGAMMAVVLTVTGCVDDNEDKGAPYLEVTPTTLAFDEEGQPADEWNGVFTVQTNRPWRATVEEEQSWVRLSATEGEGDASIAVSMPASNQGRTAKVTFAIYNSYGDLQTQVVTVAQGEIVAPTVIFNETMGTAQLDSQSWPYVADYTGWTTTGTGAEGVTFEGYNASLRNSGKSSSGAYEGASGPNVIFFGGAPATFTVKNIALTSEQTKLRLTFGGQFYDGSTNNFNVDNFEVALSADGTSFTPITYTVNDGDQVDPYWVLATSDFTLKEATSSLYIRFTAKTSSVYRLDDVTLQTGNGGQEVDLENGGGSVDPEPGDAIKTTIPELIAKMPEPMQTGTVLDAANDYYFDAVVMSDVAGGNYTYNNLALATEGATEAGNGITLYGSQIEPSTLGLTRGDKVRVTLLKGMAKYQNYSGMYELTGDKNATWCKIEKLGTATITEVKIAATELVAYQAMAVTIENASIATGGVWATTTANTSHTFTAAGQNFTVFCKKSTTENPTVFENVPFVATTGNISGLAAVFSGKGQLVPRNLQDVADFSDISTPTISGVNPTSLSFPAEGGQKTVTVSVVNKGDNLLSVSGLNGLLSATVDNSSNIVTVTAGANTAQEAVNQTMTIALAGGNSVTVPVTIAAAGGSTGGDNATLTFSLAEIKADNADLPANGYGPQLVADPATWIHWTVDGIEFTAARLCESPSNRGGVIQMQGDASTSEKQAKMQSVTEIPGMQSMTFLFRVYPSGSTYYDPSYTMTIGGQTVTPEQTYTDEGDYRLYKHVFNTSSLNATGFALDNNTKGALYIESVTIEYQK